LTSTPAFVSINNHLRIEPSCYDDLKSLLYILMYFLQGSLLWLTSDQEKLSSSFILKHKVNTTIKDLYCRIPVKFTTMLIYIHSLVFSEDPNKENAVSFPFTLGCALITSMSLDRTCHLSL
ncbi:hypothetical protein CY34DRAFT_96050, partial [Suillus luteus UH-Slu-Lm8-n1]